MCEVPVDLGFVTLRVEVGLTIETVADTGEQSAVAEDLGC